MKIGKKTMMIKKKMKTRNGETRQNRNDIFNVFLI